MKAILPVLLLPLLALSFVPLPARGQFFPDGTDYLHYVPNVPGTPAGRLYVGEFSGAADCHFRYNIPAGKTLKRMTIDMSAGYPVIHLVNSGGKIIYLFHYNFEKVNSKGQPCDEEENEDVSLSIAGSGATRGEIPVAPAGAEGFAEIPVSNTADSFDITCDGRFAVVVGRGPAPTFATPVSLVDLAAAREVDTLPFSTIVGRSVATCDDGESVLAIINDTGNARSSVGRLRIVDGKLVDTGERLAPPGTGEYRDFWKVYAVPGAKVGVALGISGAPDFTTFSIPGLHVLDTSAAPAGSAERSAVVSCAGDRIFLRDNSFAGGIPRGHIYGFTLDPVTGALGDLPFLTTDVAYTQQASTTFGDGLAISRDGARLIVPESTIGPTSPPTPRTSFLDATTGARLSFFDSFGEGADAPTLVGTYSCCAITGLRLGIQRLASGLIQIGVTGEIGRRYELQKSQNLVAWDKLSEFQMTASPMPYTDPDSPTDFARFYRLMLIP